MCLRHGGHRAPPPRATVHPLEAADDVPRDRLPAITLDPTGADHHGEAARLRAAGPVVRVVLPGGVHAWAVTRHAELSALVKDPRVSKDRRNWTAVQNGRIPDDWPLIGMLKVDNMVTAR
ncbi:hypothetical protein [Actinoallomurus iriomotensis]|nr:hypothetical protein [Actinoallomurus iriomotensis]